MEDVAKSKFGLVVWFSLFLILLAGWYFLLPQLHIKIPHSQKRGEIVQKIDNACKGNWDWGVFKNPETGRIAQVCQIEETDEEGNVKKIFGIKICEASGTCQITEITNFIKNKMTRFEQVYQYLQNSGYIEEMIKPLIWR